MAYCVNCGAKQTENGKFCAECGTAISRSTNSPENEIAKPQTEQAPIAEPQGQVGEDQSVDKTSSFTSLANSAVTEVKGGKKKFIFIGLALFVAGIIGMISFDFSPSEFERSVKLYESPLIEDKTEAIGILNMECLLTDVLACQKLLELEIDSFSNASKEDYKSLFKYNDYFKDSCDYGVEYCDAIETGLYRLLDGFSAPLSDLPKDDDFHEQRTQIQDGLETLRYRVSNLEAVRCNELNDLSACFRNLEKKVNVAKYTYAKDHVLKYSELCDKGSGKACYELADIHIKTDFDKVIIASSMERGCMNGHPAACIQRAKMSINEYVYLDNYYQLLDEDMGVVQDYFAKASNILKLGCFEKNDLDMCFDYAMVMTSRFANKFPEIKDLSEDEREAKQKEILSKNCDSDHYDSCRKYLSYNDFTLDQIAKYDNLCTKGNATSCYSLSDLYAWPEEYGDFVGKDLEKSFKYGLKGCHIERLYLIDCPMNLRIVIGVYSDLGLDLSKEEISDTLKKSCFDDPKEACVSVAAQYNPKNPQLSRYYDKIEGLSLDVDEETAEHMIYLGCEGYDLTACGILARWYEGREDEFSSGYSTFERIKTYTVNTERTYGYYVMGLLVKTLMPEEKTLISDVFRKACVQGHSPACNER